jgi:hypothetical protein
MPTRNMIIGLAALVILVWLVVSYHTFATAASNEPLSPPDFLCQQSLKGSMQGKSGIALDLNGDGNEDLVIGTPYARHGNVSSGGLLVYLASSKGFRTQPSVVLKGEGNLGWSLVDLGDLDHNGKSYFAAGAVSGTGKDSSLSGTVTIYKGGNRPQKTVTLEGENAFDRFGYSLASGDLNGDGIVDLVVGAPMYSPSPSLYQQGAVYVFFGPDFSSLSAVKIISTTAYGGLGLSLTLEDLNNDGVNDLLMGASGKVIGYYGGPSFPSPSPDVVFTSTDGGFGRAIAVLWDLDGDGFRDLALGAYQATVGGTSECGRLYIMKGGSGKRTVDANMASPDRLALIDGEPNSGQFGSAILPIRDIGGHDFVIVSAVHGDAGALSMTGKIFLLSNENLIAGVPAESLAAEAGETPNMHLGSFLAVVEGTWGKWLAAGAPTEQENTGRVRLFSLNPVGQ